MSDGPVLGKFMPSVTKCDVDPESIMIRSSSSYTPARSSLIIATLSHQVQPWPNSSLLTSMPTSFLTPQPLRAKLPTQWLRNLLLNKNDNLDDKIGFDNGILVAYFMCPPCELLVPRHELSLIRSSSNKPTYFM